MNVVEIPETLSLVSEAYHNINDILAGMSHNCV